MEATIYVCWSLCRNWRWGYLGTLELFQGSYTKRRLTIYRWSWAGRPTCPYRHDMERRSYWYRPRWTYKRLSAQRRKESLFTDQGSYQWKRRDMGSRFACQGFRQRQPTISKDRQGGPKFHESVPCRTHTRTAKADPQMPWAEQDARYVYQHHYEVYHASRTYTRTYQSD